MSTILYLYHFQGRAQTKKPQLALEKKLSANLQEGAE
jgi:hypothetical protein